MNSTNTELNFNKEAQQDEMTALSSILDSNTFVIHRAGDSDISSGVLVVNLTLPSSSFEVTSISSDPKTKISVKYLPPLTLHYTLPVGYPSTERPTFTLSSCWLDRKSLSTICRKLDSLWEDNKELNAILFVWYTFLKEEIFTELKLDKYDISWWSSGPNRKYTPEEKARLDPRAVVEWTPIASILSYLSNYNDKEIELEFTLFSHNCQICLMENNGNECLKFPCDHIYCKSCVGSYFTGLIKEGSIDSVKCPSFGCKSAPTPAQILQSVGAELFERYDRLLLHRTLDSMEDMLYCPRTQCNSHVLYDPSDKLATCSSCGYVFCSSCQMVYHGVEPCRFRATDKLNVYEKYTGGSDVEKKALEKSYGRKQLGMLVQTVLSEQWVTSRSKPCPHCSVPIEKFEGCNKVTCFKCSTFFCWNCSAQLDAGNPYFHFNDPNSRCFNTLFEGVNMAGGHNEDNDDDDDDFSDYSDEED